MATFNFPNLNLGTGPLDEFQYGLGNSLGTLGYGSGAPTTLTANQGSGTIGAGVPDNQSMTNLFSSLFSRDSMFGSMNKEGTVFSTGWVSPVAALGQSIFGAIQGQKQLALAEDQFKENRRQFDANYNAQRQSINTQLEDRQRARVASNPGAYEDTESYLARNRIR